MIIGNFNLCGISIHPRKAYSPLVIDPDTVLAFTLTIQCFKPINGGNTQIIQRLGIVEHAQLAPGDLLDVPRQTPRYLAAPNPFSFSVPKSRDHLPTITRHVITSTVISFAAQLIDRWMPNVKSWGEWDLMDYTNVNP
jgi:hypothetical protein